MGDPKLTIKAQRNLELFYAHEKGETFRSLAARFGLCSSRASEIYYMERHKQQIRARNEKARRTDELLRAAGVYDRVKELRTVNNGYAQLRQHFGGE